MKRMKQNEQIKLVLMLKTKNLELLAAFYFSNSLLFSLILDYSSLQPSSPLNRIQSSFFNAIVIFFSCQTFQSIIISVMGDNQRIDQHILDKFKIQKKLGSGAYGHVWKITSNERSGETLALKKVFEAFQHCTDAQRTFREISVLKKIEHPNIIKLHEVLPSLSGRDIYIVFQYMSTDLYHAIYEGALEEVHRKYILYQLLLGLFYLHSARLVHRDLKPSNILLSSQCQLKLCDFGLVRFLGDEREEQTIMTEGVATRWYRAPELLLGSQKYNEKVDMWSVGCILAEMVIKNPLFNCNATLSHIEKIIQVTGRPSHEQIAQMGAQGAESIIKQCGNARQKNPKQLFGAGVDDNCIDLLQNLLKFSSTKRCSAQEALRHPYLKEFFRQADLRMFKGEIKLQTDDNVKLTTEAYQELINKHFIQKKQPPRFSDLRRGDKSFGKVLSEMNSRKASNEKDRQRKNLHLFEEILREKQSSLKHARNKSSSNQREPRDKQNIMANNKQPTITAHLDKFNATKTPKQPGTFAALRKATNTLQFRR